MAEAQARTQEYRELLVEARAEMSALARQNYTLAHRMQGFEGLIRQRDNIIADLQARLKEASKVVPFKTAT